MDQVQFPATERRTIEAKPVVGTERGNFLPRVFGNKMTLAGEFAVYNWMSRVCPAYRGGFWNFYDLSNGGFYMAPEVVGGSGKLHILVETNDFEGELSPDAAGIVATLFALNSLVWGGADHLHDAFYNLREFARSHVEGASIMRAID